MKAIIAEDEIHLANDLQRRLRRLWPELEIAAIAHDGEAATAALAEHDPDIAFLDIRMPGRSGLEVAHSAPARCRVVFVTAYDEHAVQAFEQAAADYLLKPVSDERLEKCVARLRKEEGRSADSGDLLARLQQLLEVPAKPEPLRWLRAQVGQTVRMVAVEEVCCCARRSRSSSPSSTHRNSGRCIAAPSSTSGRSSPRITASSERSR